MVKHHSGEEVARNIFENVKDFVSKEEYVGGSYDGAYFHQSVPKFLAEKFKVEEEDVQDDHDWLHMCGICEKNVRKLDINDWVNKTASLSAQAFKDFNYGKSYEEWREMAHSSQQHTICKLLLQNVQKFLSGLTCPNTKLPENQR